MAEIFVRSMEQNMHKWDRLEGKTVTELLENPALFGEVYLLTPDREAVSGVEDYYRFMAKAGRHMATNYGLAQFFSTGTTQILPPGKNHFGLSLIQLTDMIVDFSTFPWNPARVNLTANRPKMFGQGKIYQIRGSFEEVIEELKVKYRFVRLPEGESPTGWLLDMKKEIMKLRKGKVTDEFVEQVNREYEGYTWRKEQLEEYFDRANI